MEIIFRGQHLTIPDEFRKHAAEHLNKLTRYLPLADHAIVDVRREAKGGEGRYVVQVTVRVNGTFEMEAAVDMAADVMARQVTRFKEKRLLRSERRVSKEDRPGEPQKAQKNPLPPDTEIVMGRVVRLKRFPIESMTEAEAIEQMELLGHSF